MFRIVIDGSLCSGFGDCADLAPDVFELEPNGKALLRFGTSVDPAVLEAAAACPMGAISVVEEGATPPLPRDRESRPSREPGNAALARARPPGSHTADP